MNFSKPFLRALRAALVVLLSAGCGERARENVKNISLDKMVRIEEGWVSMGKDRDDGAPDESPRRRVWLRGYLIGKKEVTNAEFAEFIRETGYKAQGPWERYAGPGRENHPVVAVTWHDANAYARWAGGRLPTEAEWEKAARAGDTVRPYPWPQEKLRTNACYRYNQGPGSPPTSPVGSFSPNGQGLYDTVGNVHEWCADWYDPHYYARGIDRNPKGPEAGRQRVYRGGGWASTNWLLRAANRGRADPGYWALDIGFRVSADPPGG